MSIHICEKNFCKDLSAFEPEIILDILVELLFFTNYLAELES